MAAIAPRTLLWRYGLALMAAQVVITLCIGFFALHRFRDLHREQVLNELQRVTPLLAEEYRATFANGGKIGEEVPSVQGARLNSLRVTFIRPDGVVVAESGADPAAMDNHRERTEIARAMREGSGSVVRYSRTAKKQMMYFAQRVDGESGPLGVVRAALPLSEVKSDFARVARIIALFGGLLIVLTFSVIYLVSRGLGRQLSLLNEGAARFAAGELGYRIEQPKVRELSMLSNSLNAMAAQLSDRIHELQAQQAEQQAILQSMGSAVIALDLQHRVLNVNRAAELMFHLDGLNARGRLLQEVCRQPRLHRFVADSMERSSSSTAEFQLDGTPPMRVKAVSETLRGPDGRPRGLLIVLNDVTELRRLETLRSDFAANVSHELRTPITNIKGYVETLLEVGWQDHEQAARFLQIIKKNAGRLAAIVEDVLALTRLEQPHARDSLERSSAPITSIVRSALAQFEPLAKAKNITVAVRVPPDLMVNAHTRLLEQALANLLSNAITYSEAGTSVDITAERVNGEVRIAVVDQGPGIPAEHVPRIFERFYRVDRARSRALGGTGLGLAIAKHIARLHGGRIEVETEVGRGSTFRLVVPG